MTYDISMPECISGHPPQQISSPPSGSITPLPGSEKVSQQTHSFAISRISKIHLKHVNFLGRPKRHDSPNTSLTSYSCRRGQNCIAINNPFEEME